MSNSITVNISAQPTYTVEDVRAIIQQIEEGGLPIRITLDPGAQTPTRAHTTDAGYDLYANESLTLIPGARALTGTGVHAAIPPGHVGMICPRSGLAHKKGITVLNAPGIIDAGYTGEIKVNLHNTVDHTYTINAGDRIAQLVIVPIADTHLVQVDHLEATERGSNGHGSTGQ